MATGLAIVSLLSAVGGAVQNREATRSAKNRAEDAAKEADRDAEKAKQDAIDADKKASDEADRKSKDRIRKLKQQGRASTVNDNLKPKTSGKTLLGG